MDTSARPDRADHRDEVEQVLRESEARFREAADSAPAPVWMTNTEGRVEFVNLAFQEYAGRPADQLMGDAWLSLVHPEDLPAVAARRAEAWAKDHEPYAFEARFRRSDGTWRWFDASCRPRRGGDGAFHGYVGLAIDRTDARAAEASLRASEARYRAIVESQTEMVSRFDRDGTLLFVNGAYARARGVTPEALTGVSFWDFIPEGDRDSVREVLESLTRETPEVRVENRFETADGPVWTLWTNRALSFDDEGRWLEAQSTGVDIDDRRRAEEHRKLLLDELDHRVKNTLAVVQGIAHQTFKGGAATAEARAAFEGRLSALAKAHGVLTRTNWERASLLDLAMDAAQVCGPLADRIRCSGPPVMLEPHPALSISMALHELCTNALKYGALSGNGHVDIGWKHDEGQLTLTWREEGGPPVARPLRKGYGSLLIERALAHELRGSARLDYRPAGVICVITAPLEQGREA